MRSTADEQLVVRVADAVRETGLTFERAPLVQELVARGWSRSGAYREVARCLSAPEVRMAMRDHAAVPRREAKARAHAAKELAVDTAAAIRAADILPPVASTAGGYTLGELVGMFKRSVEVVEKVLAHAHDEEGKVRLVKTALQASAQLQHSALAYAKLLEASTNATNMQAFIGEMIALLERVGRRHREAGHDIALGLQAITAKWRA